MREKIIVEILHRINQIMDEVDFTQSPDLMKAYNAFQIIRDNLQREGGWELMKKQCLESERSKE
jgi:hypothetical protein